MAYVPPHLKNRQIRSLGSTAIPSDTKPATASSPFYSLQDLSVHLDCPVGSLSTLTASPTSPDVLVAILLYEDQHPDWASAHALLCKSNLNVLHKIVDDHTGNQDTSSASNVDPLSPEYPLFTQIPFFKHGSSNKFEFAGWWRIASVQFIEPNSKELVALFERKFNGQGTSQGRKRFSGSLAHDSGTRDQGKTRSKEAWKDGLSKEWALVSLKKNEERKDAPILKTVLPSSGDVSSILRDLRNGEAGSVQPASTKVDIPNTSLHDGQDD